MEKGKEFEIHRLKEIRNTALVNLPKQMNHVNKLFVKMQDVHDMYLRAFDDDDDEIKLAKQWYNNRDKVCVSY